MGLRVAVVGATGAVGREMLTTLAERNFPADEVIALASSKSTGAQVSFGEDQVLTVADLDSYDFTGTDIALFSAGGAIAEKYAPKAA
ncbi:MAG: aspartate-semialdehyde dehydrogenase, partial [Pseudomonadota bacterium]|nr:aspartate-semialdehyde dehydrogenase [Pseudomonadota bacterium]